MNIPPDRRYTDQHEWAILEDDGLVRVGITDYAQDALGDVVFVDLPAADTHVEAGAMVAEVESTKSLAEVYAPIAGTIVRVNSALANTPELINEEPYGGGWFIVIDPDEAATLDSLLDAEAYTALVS